MKSRFFWAVVVVVGLLAIAELAARLLFGLGNPVLYAADPEIEYMLRPDQDVTRFGHRIVVNGYGMRSPAISQHKSDPRELRILVMGDSVVNGGNHIDQSELATSRLQEELARITGRPVWVGNASAGSWGPPNMLAWSRRFGFFDADAIVVVLSSHDASDVPTFVPLDPVTQPQVKPLSALQEGLTNYLPRLLPMSASPSTPSAEVQSDLRAPNQAAMQALGQLVQAARETGACVSLIQHATQAELSGGFGPGHEALQVAAIDLGIAHLDDESALSEAVHGVSAPYQDNIHLNAAGQEILARMLSQAVQGCALPVAQ